MALKRLVLFVVVTALALVLSSTAQAKKFSLIGGGGQVHIGTGLALPIQPSVLQPANPKDFPDLLIPHVNFAAVSGTTGNAATTVGTKSAYQNKLTVPAGVLKKEAEQNVVGLRFSNPALWAVGTNLNFTWPTAAATFSKALGNAQPAVISYPIGDVTATMTYSNALANRFGGPANFMLSPGPTGGVIPGAPVTIYLIINATTPACTHPAFGGSDSDCISGLMQAKPTGVQAIGGPAGVTYFTPGGTINPNIAAVQLGLTPLGTVSAALAVANNPGLPTNAATSVAGPWTTGRIVIKNGAAAGDAETFTIEGTDNRTAGGKGSIQMVAGSLSDRVTSGPNANRGWLRLELGGGPGGVPAMSPALLTAAGGLLLLAFGYVARRRLA